MTDPLGRIFSELPLSWKIAHVLLVTAGFMLIAVGAYGNSAFVAFGLFFVLFSFMRTNSVFMAGKFDELQQEIEVLRLALRETRDSAHA